MCRCPPEPRLVILALFGLMITSQLFFAIAIDFAMNPPESSWFAGDTLVFGLTWEDGCYFAIGDTRICTRGDLCQEEVCDMWANAPYAGNLSMVAILPAEVKPRECHAHTGWFWRRLTAKSFGLALLILTCLAGVWSLVQLLFAFLPSLHGFIYYTVMCAITCPLRLAQGALAFQWCMVERYALRNATVTLSIANSCLAGFFMLCELYVYIELVSKLTNELDDQTPPSRATNRAHATLPRQTRRRPATEEDGLIGGEVIAE